LGQLEGTPRLMATLMYGAGLRLLECCRLRLKDVDFSANQIVVRMGKGSKDRVTILPASSKEALIRHIAAVRRLHQRDLEQDAGWVELPYALERRYPNGGRDLAWQWLFPATRTYWHAPSGRR